MMNLLQRAKPFLFSFLLVLFYISEGIYKYFYFSELNTIKLPRIIKFIVFIGFFIYFVYKKEYRIVKSIFIISLIFVLGQFLLFKNEIPWENLIVLSKYIFLIAILKVSYLYFKNTSNKIFVKTFEILIIFNSVLIILGFLFKINLLNTYYGERFGFDGLFITSAGASYFYVISTYYLYIKFNNSLRHKFLLFFVFVGVFLTGTKALYLFIMMLLFFHIFIKSKVFSIKHILLLLGAAILLSVLFLALEPTFIDFIKEKGMLTFVLSYRDKLFYVKTLPYIKNNWNFINILFGGIGNPTLRSQLGFIDLFFTFGIIGTFYYLKTVYKNIIIKEISLNSKFIVLALIVLVFLGGNFFFNAPIAIYLVFLQQIILTENKTNLVKNFGG